ncbi:MAG: hypothetical protein KJ955_01505 [Nanoarchaeota archaeon]|nr:hypothetical protein [Nanoarchaeota archaeon]
MIRKVIFLAMNLGAKKGLELELMLAEQARVARVAAGKEEGVKFLSFLDRFADDNSFVDKGLMPEPVNLMSAYAGCDYSLLF